MLAQSDRERLGKLLGLLGSNHAGERDAAGLAAHRLVTERGLTWPQALEAAATARPSLPTFIRPWHRTVAECLQRPGSLNRWEKEFIGGLHRFPRLSAKQRTILNGIADRVLGARR